jgi:hypothetical protein
MKKADFKVGTEADALERARRFLAKSEHAISGKGGDKLTFQVALALVRKFHLTEEDALPVFQEWNQRCVPPWTEFELLHKLRSAASYSSGENSNPSFVGAATRASDNGIQQAKIRKPVFQPMVLKRVAANISSIHDIDTFLKKSSPEPVDEQDSANVLRLLYPNGTGEKVLVFSNMQSQGQFVWVADDSELITASDLPSGSDGVWFLPQPVTGKYHPNPRMDGKSSRRSEEAVTAWRYAVLESDKAEPEDWLRCLVQLPLRIACVCESGGRSIHALVRIDADSKRDWDTKIALVKPALVTLGADPGALTAMRLTRLPQSMRGTRRQQLLFLNPQPSGVPIFSMTADSKGQL